MTNIYKYQIPASSRNNQHSGSAFLVSLQDVKEAQKFLDTFGNLLGSEGMADALTKLTTARFNAHVVHKRASLLHIESVMVVALGMVDKTSKLKILNKQKEKLIGTGEDDIREDQIQELLMKEVNKVLA